MRWTREDLQRWLTPQYVLWWVFLIWASVGVLMAAAGINDAWALSGEWPDWLQPWVPILLGIGDFIFILLAAANIYLVACHRLGLFKARLGAAVIIVVSGLVEWVGTKTGIPFGWYDYSTAFGPMIGGELPAAIPLAWYSVVMGAALTITQMWHRAGRTQVALAVAFAAMIFDMCLEPYAIYARHYWTWVGPADETAPITPAISGPVPWENYLSWFGLSFVLAWILPVRSRPLICADARPPVTLAVMLLIFAVAGLGMLARGEV